MSHPLLVALPPVAVLVVAVGVAVGLVRAFGAPATTGRLVSLDGLRGYLALGVFVHHAMLWWGQLRYGSWDHPGPALSLYWHLGQGSVSLFFLMTGFLFGGKLLAGRDRPTAWSRLFVARALRIYPLYAVALAAVLLLVAVLTGFERQVPATTLARNVFAWLHFGRPDINGLPDTWLIIASVTWSLAYEWLFYCALPLVSLLFGTVPPLRWLVAGALGTALWARWIGDVQPVFLGAFGAGALVAVVLARRPALRAALAGTAGALAAIAALAVVVAAFEDSYRWPVLALLTVVFTVVASGNTLFGVLRWAPSRLLGEISYSLYLLHGLLLFVAMRGVLGTATAAALSPAAYWGTVVALVPVLVVGSYATFRLVESPAIRATPAAQRWTARRLTAGRARLDELLGRLPEVEVGGKAEDYA